MKNEEYIKYTYIHRKVVLFLANKYFKDNKELIKRVELHDLDKIFMYLFYNKKDVSRIHRELTSHHENNIVKNELDYIEMVLDWESARYTKPDKPLNAFDTLYKYYPSMEEFILPILEKIKINKSNLPVDDDVVKYVEFLGNVKITDIKDELIKYINLL